MPSTAKFIKPRLSRAQFPTVECKGTNQGCTLIIHALAPATENFGMIITTIEACSMSVLMHTETDLQVYRGNITGAWSLTRKLGGFEPFCSARDNAESGSPDPLPSDVSILDRSDSTAPIRLKHLEFNRWLVAPITSCFALV